MKRGKRPDFFFFFFQCDRRSKWMYGRVGLFTVFIGKECSLCWIMCDFASSYCKFFVFSSLLSDPFFHPSTSISSILLCALLPVYSVCQRKLLQLIVHQSPLFLFLLSFPEFVPVTAHFLCFHQRAKS